MTNREAIALVRKGINESSADSTYTNKLIYSKLKDHAKWLIPREAKSGKLYKGTSIFQTARCVPVIKVPVGSCCGVTSCCEMYRTRKKVDIFWEDAYGPIVKSINSIDGSFGFTYISMSDWQRKIDNPYNKKNTEVYAFYDDGYFWFPDRAPKKVNIQGFPQDDIGDKFSCDKKTSTPCSRFLDNKFPAPDYLTAEIIAKVVEQLAGVTKRLPEDGDINKNTNRLN